VTWSAFVIDRLFGGSPVFSSVLLPKALFGVVILCSFGLGSLAVTMEATLRNRFQTFRSPHISISDGKEPTRPTGEYTTPCRMALVLLVATFFVPALNAQSVSSRARIALFEPAGQKDDAALTAALSAVANSVELSLDLLQRYDVARVPSADPETDLDQVRAYCRKNHFDQAILGSGNPRPEGGYHFRLMVYDRKTDKVTTDQKGDSNGALDMFDVTDALVGSLLDGLSGTHLLFGSLAVESDPTGATLSVGGKDVGQTPLNLRGLPAGSVAVTARADGRETAKTTVTISDGETTNASLILPRSMGTLSVEMPNDGAAVIRSNEIGKKDVTGHGTAELPTGDYDIEASCPGLPAVAGKVTINRGESTRWLPWPKGYLDVQSDPTGATIVVDGVEKGVAPQVVEVEPGLLHRVELKKQDYDTYRADISEDAGNKTLFSKTLTLFQPGMLAVTTVAAGTLEVAGKRLQIPAGQTVELSDLPPDDYVLKVTYDDGKTESRAATVTEGKKVRVSFDYDPAMTGASLARGSILLKGIPSNVDEITVTSKSDPQPHVFGVAGTDTQQIPNLLATDTTTITFKTGNAIETSFSMTVIPQAHKELELQVPSGTISFPYLPDSAKILVDGQPIDLVKGDDGRSHTGTMLAKSYDLHVVFRPSPDFTETIHAAAGVDNAVNLPVDYLKNVYTTVRTQQVKSLNARRTLGTAGWISFVAGGLAAIGTGASYYLGAQAYSSVQTSSSQSSTASAVQQVQLYGDLFLASAIVGGVGLGSTAGFWIFSSRQPVKDDTMIKELDRHLSALKEGAGG
jgi:hypothetical protein